MYCSAQEGKFRSRKKIFGVRGAFQPPNSWFLGFKSHCLIWTKKCSIYTPFSAYFHSFTSQVYVVCSKSRSKLKMFVWKLFKRGWKCQKFCASSHLDWEALFHEPELKVEKLVLKSDQRCWRCRTEMSFLVCHLCRATQLEIVEKHLFCKFYLLG